MSKTDFPTRIDTLSPEWLTAVLRAADKPADPPMATTSGFKGIDCAQAGSAVVACNPDRKLLREMDTSVGFMTRFTSP